LKYLFSQTQTDHSQDEVVFVLIPHIVRKVELDEMSNKEISVGTASGIQLSRATPLTLPATQSAQASAAAPQAPAPQAQMPAAVAQQPPAPPTPQASPASASFNFDPSTVTAKTGATFAVNILLNGAQNVHSVPLQVSYDPKLLQVVNVSNGGFLSQDGQAVPIVNRNDDTGGTLQIDATRPPGTSGVSGQGAVITLTFMAKASGQGTLVISRGGARDPAMQAIPVTGTTATVTVQ
jgi:general secretion pathway protein D